jgi:hypothetical protein
LEIPHAHAHLYAVGIGFAEIRGLDKVHLGLLRGWTHDFTRLLYAGPAPPLRSRTSGDPKQDEKCWRENGPQHLQLKLNDFMRRPLSEPGIAQAP